jgi:hypothetical protein
LHPEEVKEEDHAAASERRFDDGEKPIFYFCCYSRDARRPVLWQAEKVLSSARDDIDDQVDGAFEMLDQVFPLLLHAFLRVCLLMLLMQSSLCYSQVLLDIIRPYPDLKVALLIFSSHVLANAHFFAAQARARGGSTRHPRNSVATGALTCFCSLPPHASPTSAPLQRHTDLTFPVETFASLVQEIAEHYKRDLGFEPDALLALQTAAEGHLVHCFKVPALIFCDVLQLSRAV